MGRQAIEVYGTPYTIQQSGKGKLGVLGTAMHAMSAKSLLVSPCIEPITVIFSHENSMTTGFCCGKAGKPLVVSL